MLEEGPRQCGAPADPCHAGPHGGCRFAQIVGTQVGEFLPFDVPPENLDGIEVRRIAPGTVQPSASAAEGRGTRSSRDSCAPEDHPRSRRGAAGGRGA
jgi:hypothetical protein